MGKLSTLTAAAALVAITQTANANIQDIISSHLKTDGPQRLYCVDSEGQFDIRLTVSESGYSHAVINKESEKSDVLARIMSTNLYPRRVIEVVQLIKPEDKKHPLTLNLISSYDCTHKQSGKTYPLRALLLDSKKANPELLGLVKGHAICCAKH